MARWTITAAAAVLLIALSPTLISAAVELVPDPVPTIELTIESEDGYHVKTLELNKCFNTFSLADTSKYYAIGAVDDDMGINFYMDDKCEEYDFSILSQITEFQGAFAGLKYAGQYKGAKPGFYENREFSETVFPDAAGTPDAAPAPDTTNPNTGTGSGTGTKPAEGTSTAFAGLAADGNTTFTNPSVGLAVGMGIIGTVTVAGIIALGVVAYRKYGGKERGDGRAFMTLSTGRDDYDEETGLAGENGPHSSALMQSRVGVSFDDERYPHNYRDEAEKSDDDDDDDDEVGLGGYPQVPEGPTQYSHEKGTLPQNLRAP